MSGVECEIYVYSACCYHISLVIALKNKSLKTKPLWFCAFKHPFTGLVNIHNNTTQTIPYVINISRLKQFSIRMDHYTVVEDVRMIMSTLHTYL